LPPPITITQTPSSAHPTLQEPEAVPITDPSSSAEIQPSNEPLISTEIQSSAESSISTQIHHSDNTVISNAVESSLRRSTRKRIQVLPPKIPKTSETEKKRQN
jgi:hypothetical protein